MANSFQVLDALLKRQIVCHEPKEATQRAVKAVDGKNNMSYNKYMKYLKNVLFILLLAVIVLTAFGVSYKIGEKIFFVYKTTVKDSLQKNVTQNSREIPAPLAGEKTEVIPSVERKLPQTAKEEVSPSPAAPVPKVMETEAQSASILVAVANVRSEPNMKSKIISKLKKGERVVVLNISGDWLHVKLSSGLTGWVFKVLTNMAQPAQKVVPPVAGEKSEVKPSVERKLPQSVKKDALPAAKKELLKAAKEEAPPAAKEDVQAAKLEATAPAVKPAAIASAVKKYKVIAGSFSIKANADSLVGQLKENNHKTTVVKAKTPKGQLYRVVVGSYRSISEAKTRIDELKKIGFQPFQIVE